MRILVLRNARAGSAGEASSATFGDSLRNAGIAVTERNAETPQDLDQLIVALGADHDAVAVGGGDGTLRDSLRALLVVDRPLAVWPLGTANDFARSIGIENEADAIAAIQDPYEQRVDVGSINDLFFLNSVAIGLPAEAAARLTGELKERFGIWASLGLLPALWRRANPTTVDIEADERKERRSILAAMVSNGRYEGGVPVRYSALADGRLHATVCKASARWELLPILLDLGLKALKGSNRIETFSADRVSITTRRRLPISVDGDVLTETPAKISIHSSKLRVFAKRP